MENYSAGAVVVELRVDARADPTDRGDDYNRNTYCDQAIFNRMAPGSFFRNATTLGMWHTHVVVVLQGA